MKKLNKEQGSLQTKKTDVAFWNTSFALRRVYGTWRSRWYTSGSCFKSLCSKVLAGARHWATHSGSLRRPGLGGGQRTVQG
jgi:hypothetical protein